MYQAWSSRFQSQVAQTNQSQGATQPTSPTSCILFSMTFYLVLREFDRSRNAPVRSNYLSCWSSSSKESFAASRRILLRSAGLITEGPQSLGSWRGDRACPFVSRSQELQAYPNSAAPQPVADHNQPVLRHDQRSTQTLKTDCSEAGESTNFMWAAKTADEACKLFEVGFDYVCDIDDAKPFRKRKGTISRICR